MAMALKKTTGNSIASIAQKIGVPQTTLNRQAKENEIPTNTFVRICLEYHVSVIDVLLSAELITADQAKNMRGVTDINAYSQVELAEEVYNRELQRQMNKMKERKGHNHLYALAAETDNQPDLPEGEMY